MVTNQVDIEFEMAFARGWQEITDLPLPKGRKIREHLNRCRNTSEAKYIGRQCAIDFEFERYDKCETEV